MSKFTPTGFSEGNVQEAIKTVGRMLDEVPALLNGKHTPHPSMAGYAILVLAMVLALRNDD